jgi:hypothetical protein
MILKVPGVAYGLSPFERPSRHYPLTARVGRLVDRASIKIPKGYRVRYLPSRLALNSPFAGIKASYRQEKGMIKLEVVTDYHATPLLPKDYARVREQFRRRARFTKEMIVFEKLR